METENVDMMEDGEVDESNEVSSHGQNSIRRKFALKKRIYRT